MSITMTLDLYSHCAEGLQEDAAQRIDGIFDRTGKDKKLQEE